MSVKPHHSISELYHCVRARAVPQMRITPYVIRTAVNAVPVPAASGLDCPRICSVIVTVKIMELMSFYIPSVRKCYVDISEPRQFPCIVGMTPDQSAHRP